MSNQAVLTHLSTRRGAMLGMLLATSVLFAVARPSFGAQAPSPAVSGDLSVDDAVRLALEKNQDLLSSQNNVDAASGARKQALQSYLPYLSANYAYSRNFNEDIVFNPATNTFTGTPDNFSSRYTLRQNIIDFGSFKNIKAAGKDLAASKLNYQFSRSDLVLIVKTQYYALVSAQLVAQVNDSALAVSERELERTQSLFELGMVAKSDVLKAQVRVSNSKLDVIRARGDMVNQRARLAVLLAQEPTDDLRASDRLSETPVSVDSLAIYQDAVAKRPDLQASYESWQADQSRASAAKAGFLPTVGGSVTYSSSSANGLVPFSGFTEPVGGSRGASVGLSVPFLDGVVGRRGTIQAANARAEQSRYAYEKKKLDIAVEVREAINLARQANEGVQVAKDGLASAEEDLKLSQEKYNVGSGTILELLDAQVNLQSARQQYVNALTAARVAEARIERARGTPK